MSPSAEGQAAPLALPMHAEILSEGEQIIFSIKPSLWYVVLLSWPVIAVAAIIIAGFQLLGEALGANLGGPTVRWACLAIIVLRVVLAVFQWLGHLYILTNLRALHVRGTTNPEVSGCLLKTVKNVVLSATLAEKILFVGNLSFISSETGYQRVTWLCVPRPKQLRQRVQDAINAAR